MNIAATYRVLNTSIHLADDSDPGEPSWKTKIGEFGRWSVGADSPIVALQEALDKVLGETFVEPTECRVHTCTYFASYLAAGPVVLAHEGFHAAEKQRAYWQSELDKHLDSHDVGRDCDHCARLERICATWEKRVRA
jgi:hypothetical protein